MSDLILGHDWLGRVHHLPGRLFGSGPSDRATIVGSLTRQARYMPESPFLTYAGETAASSTVTYAQAHAEVGRRAGQLARWGLQRGDRVGVLGANSIHFVYAVLAVLEAGGVAVPLNPHDPSARTCAHVEFTQVRMLLHDEASAATVASCSSVERSCSFERFQQEAPQRYQTDARANRPNPTDAALIFFTSGTTATPKAVVQSHYNVAQNAWALAEHHGIGPGVRLLCVLPLHHVNGLQFTCFGALVAGGHTVICRGFDGLRFWPTVRAHGIQIISLVPNLLALLADRPELLGPGPGPVRYIVSAAAPLSVGIARRVWDRLGLRIVQGYGLSEVTNFSCLLPTKLSDEDYRRWMWGGRRTCVGSALPGHEVEVYDGDEAAAPGVEGEIVIRGNGVMSGYLHNDQATVEAFHGGWFHTGDLGYYLLDEQGRKCFHVSGRRREIAKRGGAMVSLLEVDEVLASIPGVADAGAAAFANNWVDEEIAAVLAPVQGASLTPEIVNEYCRRILPFAAMPKAIKTVDAVPRTASGKIRRADIAQHFAALRERLFVESTPTLWT